MGGYSQQVPHHVAPHTVISPVLSQHAMTPDSTMNITPRGVGSGNSATVGRSLLYHSGHPHMVASASCCAIKIIIKTHTLS